jgi:hypothetical protein
LKSISPTINNKFGFVWDYIWSQTFVVSHHVPNKTVILRYPHSFGQIRTVRCYKRCSGKLVVNHPNSKCNNARFDVFSSWQLGKIIQVRTVDPTSIHYV